MISSKRIHSHRVKEAHGNHEVADEDKNEEKLKHLVNIEFGQLMPRFLWLPLFPCDLLKK